MTEQDPESYVRTNIGQIAEETFPDNVGLDWRIHSIDHRPPMMLVEVEPIPDEVGYPRFKFMLLTHQHPPVHVATYCLEGASFNLLCSDPSAPPDLPKQV